MRRDKIPKMGHYHVVVGSAVGPPVAKLSTTAAKHAAVGLKSAQRDCFVMFILKSHLYAARVIVGGAADRLQCRFRHAAEREHIS